MNFFKIKLNFLNIFLFLINIFLDKFIKLIILKYFNIKLKVIIKYKFYI